MQLQIQLIEMFNEQQGRQTEALGLQEGLAEAHIKKKPGPKIVL